MRLAGPRLLAARAAMAAEHEKPSGIVGHHLAEGVDRERRQARGRKRRRIIALAAAIEGGAALAGVVDDPRAGIEDEAIAVGDIGVASRIIVGITVLALAGVELVPAGLLVGDIDLPLDIDQRAGIAATFDAVADIERAAVRRHLVIDEHLEARGLALDPALGVAEIRHQHWRDAIGLVERIAQRVAGLPQACDALGNPLYQADGITPVLVTNFRDAEGRIKRQAARFQVFVYDEVSPHGRPLNIGNRVEGGGNAGTLVDIEWQVYVANKKACWYQFDTSQGEHGYPDDYPRRNADVTDRDRLIIDPGPRIVNHTSKRRASFDRSGEGNYATTFPPPGLTPFSIDTLGEMMADDSGRLLVLGGHGRSGSEKSGPGEPHITNYANNDGWYDDTSDGPVMARLVMYAENVGKVRYVDVDYPAWVVASYPRYVPVVLDMVTMDEVLYDLFIRAFADDTALYGVQNTFDQPQHIDFHNEAALRQWRDGRLAWNRAYKPWL